MGHKGGACRLNPAMQVVSAAVSHAANFWRPKWSKIKSETVHGSYYRLYSGIISYEFLTKVQPFLISFVFIFEYFYKLNIISVLYKPILAGLQIAVIT